MLGQWVCLWVVWCGSRGVKLTWFLVWCIINT
nr:MAG TPA: coat protein [Caudoviricetes sp.]